MHFDPIQMTAIIIVGYFAIGLHEYAHCKFADMAGDPTPGFYGRVTLNLTKHFEPVGTIMMLITAVTGYGIGWGRPAPINPSKMRNPRWDTFIAVAAGPLSNVLQAVVWAICARLMLSTNQVSVDAIKGQEQSLVGMILFVGVTLNLSLAFFNLFPIPPLDGHWLVGLLLPERLRDKWFLYCRQYGWYVLLGLVIIGQSIPSLSVFRLASKPLFHVANFLFGTEIFDVN